MRPAMSRPATAETTFTVGHHRKVFRRARDPACRTQLRERVGIATRRVRGHARCLPHHPHPRRSPASSQGVLIGQARVVVDQTAGHDEVPGNGAGSAAAQRAQLRTDVVVELSSGDLRVGGWIDACSGPTARRSGPARSVAVCAIISLLGAVDRPVSTRLGADSRSLVKPGAALLVLTFPTEATAVPTV